MTEQKFTDIFLILQVLDNYLTLPLLFFYFRSKKRGAARWMSLTLGLTFLLFGIFAGVMLFFVEHGWHYTFRIWWHSISWRYDWYCTILFLAYCLVGLYVIYSEFLRKIRSSD